ncbi:APC family permease [Steroidobacter flavus]|uniref:APC family permease n=1 Tax=Steroidobacter flavus TaxID=1842136 RepID=A0ABV8SNK6_9GAMM
MSLRSLILGRRLANRELRERRIGAFEGVPAMGLDGLGSSSYGPEAALSVLIPLGAASLSYIGWVMAPIVGLLAILFASYWQTIRAYPHNGGAYIVAKENLGSNASLLAAAALMIDYVLNVAVGISAGVGALVSAVPALHDYMLLLCLLILAFITVMNLRGTIDAGRMFAVPTYTFVISFALIIAVGVWKVLMDGGNPQPVVPPPPLAKSVEAVNVWLLLRAFAAGCTAMTGVEAVSNGMTAFRDPTVKYGHRTLTAIVGILGALLIGIAYLATVYKIGAMDQSQAGYRSVLSQLASAVVGDGPLYYVAIGSLLCVLALSANTSFVDFPRLCHVVAQDGFLPRPFAVAGHRLVFSVGILYLAMTAGALLVVFGGITDHLIPLFAVGAFATFTLSQSGMVVHWLRLLRKPAPAQERRRHRMHLAINAVGAVTTGVALIVIVVAKFVGGAWITVMIVPAVILLLKSIKHYYEKVAARTRQPSPLQVAGVEPPVVLVTIDDWNALAEKGVALALSLSPHVVGVHLAQLEGPDSEDRHKELHERWEQNVAAPCRRAGRAQPMLCILQAQYRAIHVPILKLSQELQINHPGRAIAVLIPELIKQRWYQRLLHTQHARYLRRKLLEHGGSLLTVIEVPWYLEEVQALEPRQGGAAYVNAERGNTG